MSSSKRCNENETATRKIPRHYDASGAPPVVRPEADNTKDAPAVEVAVEVAAAKDAAESISSPDDMDMVPSVDGQEDDNTEDAPAGEVAEADVAAESIRSPMDIDLDMMIAKFRNFEVGREKVKNLAESMLQHHEADLAGLQVRERFIKKQIEDTKADITYLRKTISGISSQANSLRTDAVNGMPLPAITLSRYESDLAAERSDDVLFPILPAGVVAKCPGDTFGFPRERDRNTRLDLMNNPCMGEAREFWPILPKDARTKDIPSITGQPFMAHGQYIYDEEDPTSPFSTKYVYKVHKGNLTRAIPAGCTDLIIHNIILTSNMIVPCPLITTLQIQGERGGVHDDAYILLARTLRYLIVYDSCLSIHSTLLLSLLRGKCIENYAFNQPQLQCILFVDERCFVRVCGTEQEKGKITATCNKWYTTPLQGERANDDDDDDDWDNSGSWQFYTRHTRDEGMSNSQFVYSILKLVQSFLKRREHQRICPEEGKMYPMNTVAECCIRRWRFAMGKATGNEEFMPDEVIRHMMLYVDQRSPLLDIHLSYAKQLGMIPNLEGEYVEYDAEYHKYVDRLGSYRASSGCYFREILVLDRGLPANSEIPYPIPVSHPNREFWDEYENGSRDYGTRY